MKLNLTSFFPTSIIIQIMVITETTMTITEIVAIITETKTIIGIVAITENMTVTETTEVITKLIDIILRNVSKTMYYPLFTAQKIDLGI